MKISDRKLINTAKFINKRIRNRYFYLLNRLPDYSINKKNEYKKKVRGGRKVMYDIITRIVNPYYFSSNKCSYYFEGLRNFSYIRMLPKEKIVVFASFSEIIKCIRYGVKFIPSFTITHSVQRFFYDGDIELMINLSKKFNKFFLNKKSYFFVWEDTQPLGSFIVTNAKYISNCTTICIQHGDFHEKSISSKNDGYFCDINLVNSKKQFEVINPISDAYCIVGYDVGNIKRINANANELIFVSTGDSQSHPDRYSNILEQYNFINNRLNFQKHKINISYRTHPKWDGLSSEHLKYFNDTDLNSKEKTLSGKRKVFVGFYSTFLQEAEFLGHVVIKLDTKYAYDSIAMDDDYITQINNMILGYLSEQPEDFEVSMPKLKNTFLFCLEQVGVIQKSNQ
jgi:cellulose biosynthesis protein BcsQ